MADMGVRLKWHGTLNEIPSGPLLLWSVLMATVGFMLGMFATMGWYQLDDGKAYRCLQTEQKMEEIRRIVK